MKKILSVVAMLVVLLHAAFSADIVWTNTTGGSWTNADNWDSGYYPGEASSDNAFLTNDIPGSARITLDKTLEYYVSNVTISNGIGTTEFFITNNVASGTTVLNVYDNGRITVAPGSTWDAIPNTGSKNFTGTNIEVNVGSNAQWHAGGDFRLGLNTVNGDYRVYGGGEINNQFGGLYVGFSNNAPATLTYGNVAIVDGMTFRNAYPQVGYNSAGNTLILTNTIVVPGYIASSWRAGATGTRQCSSNTLVLTGSRTLGDLQGSYVYVPNAQFNTGCVIRVENGAVLTNSLTSYQAVGIPQVNNCSEGSFLISSGGRAFRGNWSVGTGTQCHSNLLSIVGSGSRLDAIGYYGAVTVGRTAGATTGNVLRVSDGGDLRGVSVLTIQPNNSLEFTEGRIAAHDFNYNPPFQYVLGSNCTFAVEEGPPPTRIGVWTFAGDLLVDSNATLRGRGIIRAASPGITLTNGATIIGSKEGELALTNLTWAGGATYVSKVDDLLGRPGSGWGFLNIGTQLSFVAASPNYVVSLDTDGVTLPSFDPSRNYVMKIAEASRVITGLDFSKFTLNTNGFLLPATPTATWTLTNFANKIFLTYEGTNEVYDNGGYAWNSASNGNWSLAADWTNNVAPTSGVGMVLEFSGSGSGVYFATNDVASPMDVNKLLFTSSSTGTNVLAGSQIRFNGADAGIWKNGGGYYIVSNAVDLASDTTFKGSMDYMGSIVFASNISGVGSLTKRGPWMMVMQGSNSFSGSVIVESSGGGGLQLDAGSSLSSSHVYVTNGIIYRTTTAAHTFGNRAAIRDYLLTGPGSLYQLSGAYTIGSNATVTVTNRAQIITPSSITVNGSGTVTDPLHICGGVVRSAATSYIGNSNNNNLVTIHAGGEWDLGNQPLYVGSGTGTNNVLVVDNGTLNNAYGVYLGGVSGVAGNNYNGLLVTNGGVVNFDLTGSTAGEFRIGQGTGASYNWVHVAPGSKVYNPSGASGNPCYAYVGYGSESTGNWMRIEGEYVVTPANNNTGLRVGYNGGVAGTKTIGNHLEVVNGGYLRHCRPGGTAPIEVGTMNGVGACSYSNYLYVAGTGTVINMSGQGLGVGISLGAGAASSTGNYIRIENGALVDNANAITIGASVYSGTMHTNAYGNHISVSNATLLSGFQGSGLIIGNNNSARNNYLEVVGGSTWRHSASAVSIGGFAGGSITTSRDNAENYIKIDGSTAENLGSIRLGGGSVSTCTDNNRNYFLMTNGASVSSYGTATIGYTSGCHSNYVVVTGSNTVWDLGSSTMGVGVDSGCVGNYLKVDQGGVKQLCRASRGQDRDSRGERDRISLCRWRRLAGGEAALRSNKFRGLLQRACGDK